jgi:hypothetical protein
MFVWWDPKTTSRDSSGSSIGEELPEYCEPDDWSLDEPKASPRMKPTFTHRARAKAQLSSIWE